MNVQEKQHVLCLNTKTWSRDSHGLYDYESTSTKTINIIVVDSAIIVRKKLEIRPVQSMDDIKDEEYLMEIKHDKGNYL
jgi:hypothetical protein